MHKYSVFRTVAIVVALTLLGGAAAFCIFAKKPDRTVIAADRKGLGPENRRECENAEVYTKIGGRKTGGTKVKDKNASGGTVAGSTGGKYFLFKDAPEANIIHIAYASPNTSTIQALIRYPDSEEFTPLCTIDFSTSNSWEMNSSYIAVSPSAYIPEGSDIMLRPSVDVNLDYLYFTFENANAGAKVPEGTLNADSLSDQAEEDIMAPYGKALTLTAGSSFTVNVPDGGQFNVLSVSYTSASGAVLNVTVSAGDGDNACVDSDRFELGATALRSYAEAGMRLPAFKNGDKLTITCESGELRIAYIKPAYAPESPAVNIGKLPSGSGRMTVNLDGTWSVDAAPCMEWNVPESVPELFFANTVPVPGLWGDAAYPLGSYSSAMMCLRRELVLGEEPSGQVLLRIGSAMYGRYIFVNGKFAGSYEYNYSSSVTDLTGMLHKGSNWLVIMLGSFGNQFNNPATPAHVLYDGESTGDEPGITDCVDLIFNAGPEVEAVQVAPDIDAGKLTAKVRIRNRRAEIIVTDVKFTVYELGRFTDGKADADPVKVGEFTVSGVSAEPGETAEFTAEDIALSNWDRSRCWTPENPFLYRLDIETSGDTYSIRFGMRTFSFEPGTGSALLNGERRYLFGTNVAIERYFDDPLCGTTPWDEAWIRKLYKEYRSINWTCFRTHLGHANSKWFDIADEVGMMIFDEYPIWGNAGDDSEKTIMPEIRTWIDDRGYHPSLIVFDAQNEATYNLTDKIIKNGREYDLQKRPWDNGWRAPVGELDPIECHPYILGSKGISGIEEMTTLRPRVTTIDLGWKESDYEGHAFILNEHGEYWINREGRPMSATEDRWNNALPGVSNEKRLSYFCELMSAQLEAFRAGRSYSGLLFFCGLGSSTPSALGVTSDVLEPDVSRAGTLSIHPYFKYLMENTNAPLGIVINTYTEKRAAGDNITVPVVLVNDTGKDVTELPVTLVVRAADGTVLWAERRTMSVPAFSADNKGTSTELFELAVPSLKKYCAPGSELTVQAYYVLDGRTVFSQRKWTVSGGKLTDGGLPGYDWLELKELPKEYKAEDYLDIDGEEGEDGNTEETPHENRNRSDAKTALKKALPWIIAGAAVLIAGGVAAAVIVRKKKK